MAVVRRMTQERDRALKSLGGSSKAAAMFRRREKSFSYIQDHFDELMEQYPEHWIAVCDSAVVAAALTLPELEQEVESTGSDQSEVVVRHLTKVPQVNFF